MQPKVEKRDKFGGEFPAIEQRPGEYVPEVDTLGRDIPQERAGHREREPFLPRPAGRLTEPKDVVLQDPEARVINKQRRKISLDVRAKPIPSVRLAYREFKQALEEAKTDNMKTPKQRAEEEAARVKQN